MKVRCTKVKFKQAFQYQLKRGLSLLGWTYLCVLIAVTIVPLLITTLMGRISTIQVSDFLPSGILEFAILLFLIFYSVLPYDGFQFMIQNGVGRKTYFYARTLTTCVLALFGCIVSVIYNFAISPFNSEALSNDLFGMREMYAHFFSNALVGNMVSFIVWVLFTICMAASWTLAGSILSLFDRRIQIALVIGVPIVFFIAATVVSGLNVDGPVRMTWIGNIVYWIAGENKATDLVTYNPFQPLFAGVVYALVVFGGSYFFNLKLKTPR